MTLKNGFGLKCSLFVLSEKRSKHGLFVFPPKKTVIIMEKAWFDWPIVLPYDVKAKYRFISRKFSGMKFFQETTKTMRICIRSINQSNRSISVRLLFLFWARVFISRSYENRSILQQWRQNDTLMTSYRGEFRVGLIPIAMEMPKCQRKWLWNLPYLFD